MKIFLEQCAIASKARSVGNARRLHAVVSDNCPLSWYDLASILNLYSGSTTLRHDSPSGCLLSNVQELPELPVRYRSRLLCWSKLGVFTTGGRHTKSRGCCLGNLPYTCCFLSFIYNLTSWAVFHALFMLASKQAKDGVKKCVPWFTSRVWLFTVDKNLFLLSISASTLLFQHSLEKNVLVVVFHQ